MLSFGIIAALLSLGTDLLAGMLLKGYSFASDSMSEFVAAGSPVRSLVLTLSLVSRAFMIAFGVGVWRVGGASDPAPYCGRVDPQPCDYRVGSVPVLPQPIRRATGV